MKKRIHILGASGSGTSTLALHLANELDIRHYDTDDFFWEKTDPPFQTQRERSLRQQYLKESLDSIESWVLSGSLCGWGDMFIPYFDLVVFLWLPEDIRIERLKSREKLRHGPRIDEFGDMHDTYQAFIDWAAQYDSEACSVGRNIKMHRDWLSNLPCKVLRIEGEVELNDKLQMVLDEIEKL